MNINPSLLPLARPVTDFKPDPRNARSHNKRSIDAIGRSLTRFGQQKPIVVSPDGIVIAGNGMFMSARQLGWEQIAVVVFHGNAGEAAAAFGIADNRSAELSEWDEPTLVNLIRELNKADTTLLPDVGFSDEELSALLKDPDEGNKGRGVKPTIGFSIVFDDIGQQEKWYAFIRKLAAADKELTIGARLIKHIESLPAGG